MVVAEKLQVQGFHYPFPGLGNVVKDGDGREHWVLATPEYLRKVEVDKGLILVDWPLEPE